MASGPPSTHHKISDSVWNIEYKYVCIYTCNCRLDQNMLHSLQLDLPGSKVIESIYSCTFPHPRDSTHTISSRTKQWSGGTLNMSTYLTAANAWSTSRSEYFSVLPLSGPWNGQEHVFTPHVHVRTDFLCDTGDRSPNTTSWLRPQVHRKFVTKMQKDCHYITVCGTHWNLPGGCPFNHVFLHGSKVYFTCT